MISHVILTALHVCSCLACSTLSQSRPRSLSLFAHPGGQVPKPPHFQAPLGSTGILPALEQIARHVHFRSEVSAALEAAIPAGCVSRTAMNVSMHQHRSEAGTFSRFTVTASAGDAPESPFVVIDVSLRGTQCTVATTPSVSSCPLPLSSPSHFQAKRMLMPTLFILDASRAG